MKYSHRHLAHRSVAALMVLSLMGPDLEAQSTSPHDIMRHEDAVSLVAPEGYLDSFWAACASLDRPESEIVVHLGDSHLQAGFVTMPIREFFQRQFGLSGPGLIAPYALTRTNEPQHLRLRAVRGHNYRTDLITRRSYQGYGPTGIEAHSTSGSAQEVTLSTRDGSHFDRVIVFHDPKDRTFSLPNEMSENTPLPYSLEVSAFTSDTLLLRGSATSVGLTIPAGATFYGASLESAVPGVVVHTLGHNGATYDTYLKGDFPKALAGLKPDLIIISLGTNDSMGRISGDHVRSAVHQLVRRIHRSSPAAKIVLTTPLVNYGLRRRSGSPNTGVRIVSEAIRAEAKDLGVGYIDTFRAFGGMEGASILVSSDFLQRDRIHLTKDGYQALGNAISDALAKDYKRYLSTQPLTL